MRSLFLGFLAVLAVSAFLAFRGLDRASAHPDESLWIMFSQKSWGLFSSGNWDDPQWKSLDATWGYVNPPVAKYVMGMSLSAAGEDWKWKLGESPPTSALVAARWPSALLGVLGCLGLWWIALETLGAPAAIIAALLLAASPLWLVVSRHAMTDVHGTAFAILSVGAFLPASRELGQERRWRVLAPWIALSGALSGLAVGSKLNAAPTPIALGILLLIVLSRESIRRPRARARDGILLVALPALFAAAAVAVFVGLNPYLHEDGWNRFAGILAFWRNLALETASRTDIRSFLPEQKGVRMMVDKLIAPPRPAGLLLLVPLAVGLVARGRWFRSSPESSRRLAWLALIPATLIIARTGNLISLAWLPWIGLLGAGLAFLIPKGGERPRGVTDHSPLLIPVWAAVVTFLVWKSIYMPRTRYYLPLLPLACLGAGYGLAVLRRDLAVGGRPWSRRFVDVAILAGILAIAAAFPDFEQTQVRDILTAQASLLPRSLQWLSIASLTFGVGAGVLPGGIARFRR